MRGGDAGKAEEDDEQETKLIHRISFDGHLPVIAPKSPHRLGHEGPSVAQESLKLRAAPILHDIHEPAASGKHIDSGCHQVRPAEPDCVARVFVNLNVRREFQKVDGAKFERCIRVALQVFVHECDPTSLNRLVARRVNCANIHLHRHALLKNPLDLQMKGSTSGTL